MLKKFLAVSSVLTFAVAANAAISAQMVPLFDKSENYATTLGDGTVVSPWELQVTVTDTDVWTCAGGPDDTTPWLVMDPTDSGTFYNDTVYGGDGPPNPAFFPLVADLPYDSFYTTPEGWPNSDPNQGVAPGFATGPVWGATSLLCDWYWTPPEYDLDGTYTIARISIIPDDPTNWWADVDVRIGSRDNGSVLIPHQQRFGIPEPASLALLALGGLALARRR